VLSTLNKDGSRRWLTPSLSPGRFLRRRRGVAYALLVLYNALPWIPIAGKPAILLDLPRREFTFFGTTFLPTDTLLLMLFMAGVFVTIFLLTALFGRLWCGWACPQTVYMEYVYRPIERLFDGAPDARGRVKGQKSPVRRVLKYAVFFVISLHLAHTFLAYFVGVENLLDWTWQSPFEHPTAFIIVWAVTGLMMFDFCFFREQVCIVACPYGRFQSVLLDRNSLIISYDEKRGEPRGAMRRAKNGEADQPRTGDCIDCSMCVTTCPTGIDIRDGLQLECIGCAQCIDACDAIMDKIGRDRGLVRYSSQETMEAGRRRLFRPRVAVYPLLLAIVVAAFVLVLTGRKAADVTVLRGAADPYRTLDSGEIANAIRVKVTNRTDDTRRYTIGVDGIDGARIIYADEPFEIDAGASRTAATTIIVPRSAFSAGRARIGVLIADDAEFEEQLPCWLQGPWGGGGAK
jgi:cytochrome c oxidase accessory protein FixG